MGRVALFTLGALASSMARAEVVDKIPTVIGSWIYTLLWLPMLVLLCRLHPNLWWVLLIGLSAWFGFSLMEYQQLRLFHHLGWRYGLGYWSSWLPLWGGLFWLGLKKPSA